MDKPNKVAARTAVQQHTFERNVMLSKAMIHVRKRLKLHKGLGEQLNCLIDLSEPRRIKVTVLRRGPTVFQALSYSNTVASNAELYTKQRFWATATWNASTERFNINRVMAFKDYYPTSECLWLFTVRMPWSIDLTPEEIASNFERRPPPSPPGVGKRIMRTRKPATAKVPTRLHPDRQVTVAIPKGL